MSREYCVVIGDVIASRQLDARGGFQERFKDAVQEINRRFEPDIVSRFVVTLGDEFQGVLRDPSPSYEVVVAVRERLHPVQLRFGIGVGTITTEITPEAIGMDGPAFYESRRALEQAEREGREIRFQGLGEDLDATVNTLALLLSALTSRWTKRQMEVIGLYRRLGSQAKVAQELGVSRANVNKMLSAAHWEAVREGEEAIIKVLTLERFR